MPQRDSTHLQTPRNLLRLLTLQQLAEALGITVRQARDWLKLHPAIRTYQHARSTIRLISADDVEALVGAAAASQEGTTSNVTPIRTEPSTVDDVLAAVGRRRRGGAR